MHLLIDTNDLAHALQLNSRVLKQLRFLIKSYKGKCEHLM